MSVPLLNQNFARNTIWKFCKDSRLGCLADPFKLPEHVLKMRLSGRGAPGDLLLRGKVARRAAHKRMQRCLTKLRQIALYPNYAQIAKVLFQVSWIQSVNGF